MGLVTKVLADAEAVQKEAFALAEQIAANSPLAVQGTKAVLQAGRGRSIEESLDYVALWNAAYLHSDDLVEAMAAFAERRSPDFQGR
jgi:enoyl-CoA hydratase